MEKIALITGVSSGLGKTIAKLLLKNGCQVIGLSRREPKKLKKEWPDKFRWHFVDFSLPDSITTLYKEKLSKYNQINLLIHSAGQGHFIKFIEMDCQLIKRIVNVNLTSPLLLTKKIIPSMEKGGQVIFITSSATKIPSPLSSIYAATKTAQESMAASLNIEYANSDIKFKILRPSLIKTDFLTKSGIPSEEISTRIIQSKEKVALNLMKLIKNKSTVRNSGLSILIISVLGF